MSVKPVDLPEECWELIFRSLDHRRHYEHVSLVCKQFLSITNRLQSSLTIFDQSIPFLPRFFLRFPRLKFIDLSHFRGDLDRVLHLIARSELALDSLNISNQKILILAGLRELGLKMRSLRVLICSRITSLCDSDLLVIAECFPFLHELDISFPKDCPDYMSTRTMNDPSIFAFHVSDFGIKSLAIVLKNLRKVNLSGHFFLTNEALLFLCKNCEFLSEIAIFDCSFITQVGIASAIRERPNLTSITLGYIGNGSLVGGPNICSEFVHSLLSLKSLTTIDFSFASVTDEFLCSVAEEGLPLKKLILMRSQKYTYAGIFTLLSKCQSVQYLDLEKVDCLTDHNMKELSLLLPNLTFINLSYSCRFTNSTFFFLTRNCPLLSVIQMEGTELGKDGLEDCSEDFVNSHVKSLHLRKNSNLRDEDIKRFASICPNLEFLDLRFCRGISEVAAAEALKKCNNIRHLKLSYCSNIKHFVIDFQVPKLEVLNLRETRITDEALSVISKYCGGLTHLNLRTCLHVTANGVKQVVQKCTRLREINVKICNQVLGADIIPWMVFSRPSLRKIMVPPCLAPTEGQKKLFLRHGCLVCSC